MVISHSNCKYIIVVDLVIGFTEYRTCYLTWVCILDIYGTIYFDSGGHVFFTERNLLMNYSGGVCLLHSLYHAPVVSWNMN